MTIDRCTHFPFREGLPYSLLQANKPLASPHTQWRIQDFPLGGGGALTRWEGRRPLTLTLFGKNVCENERN